MSVDQELFKDKNCLHLTYASNPSRIGMALFLGTGHATAAQHSVYARHKLVRTLELIKEQAAPIC